ncbi:phage antirepressor YoqD-like protein [Acinetobacter lwoffii]|jgi:phage antirepressor YoqD-like protein|uniref:Phage antirepressor YoqD-like protein n=1 Tax=Acinetobacter lwoffii TaxID=28090 RepID=A0AAW8L6P6_ACILW|nr:phage antirepressor KilAC domain-containing protein [Acinetobacter lwoffii]MDR6628375.1 phage antirepressor YoqD-like protein [Acinetobacter lwoffii]
MNAKLNNSVTVADKVLDIVEYQGQRVVTFAMVDEVHGRPEGTAKRNFGTNKKHLTEGEDYFEVGKDEIRSNLQDGVFSKFASNGVLITESGYLMLVKSFTDDLAWKVQKQLVKGYFKAKELIQNFDPMKSLADPRVLRDLLLGYSERIVGLEEEVQEMKPSVEAYDRIAKADGSLCLTDAAKALQMRPKDLIAKLSSGKWIYKRAGNSHWLGYQDKVQAGYLEHKITEVTRGDGTTKITEQVRITPKGLAKLAKDQGGTA